MGWDTLGWDRLGWIELSWVANVTPARTSPPTPADALLVPVLAEGWCPHPQFLEEGKSLQ